MNHIQFALARKRKEAEMIADIKDVRELSGLDWPEFLKQMRLVIWQLRPKPWDQYIACEVYDLINKGNL